MTVPLLDGERIDDLQFLNLRIIQREGAFCFSMDSVLLADFAMARARDVVVDFGTGTGILPLLISGRAEKTTFHAFEIQADMADMAARSVKMNGLEDRIAIYHDNLINAAKRLGHACADLVVANPPYAREGASIQNPSLGKRIARHEGESTLDDFVKAAAEVLKTRGRFAMVFPAHRMLEVMDCMRQYKIEPKRMRLVHPKPDRKPNLALIEGVRLGKSMLHIEPPLIVYDENGNETDEIKRIYHRADSPLKEQSGAGKDSIPLK